MKVYSAESAENGVSEIRLHDLGEPRYRDDPKPSAPLGRR